MSALENPLITVGIADSDEARSALDWAARFAQAIGGRLHLLHAFVWAGRDINTDPIPGVSGSGLRAAADRMLEDAVQQATRVAPDATITTAVADGSRIPVMLTASQKADVIVVGARGLGRFLAAIAGSTSRALARQAACPVVVVRHHSTAGGPVGISYEIGRTSDSAVARAAELAQLLDVPLVAVHGPGVSAEEHADVQRALGARLEELAPDLRLGELDIPEDGTLSSVAASTAGLSVLVVSEPETAPRTDRALRVADTAVWIERD